MLQLLGICAAHAGARSVVLSDANVSDLLRENAAVAAAECGDILRVVDYTWYILIFVLVSGAELLVYV
jgi:hypothetical protein